MTTPGVEFAGVSPGAGSVTPTGGVGGLVLALPADEPLSVGPLPVAPDLVRSVDLAYAVRSVRSRSGALVTSPLASVPRPAYRLSWSRLTESEAAELRAFMVDDAEGVRFAFDLEIDGVGSGATVTVRALGPLVFERVAVGVLRVPELLVEEVGL